MRKLNLKPVGEIVVKAGKAIGCGILAFAPSIIESYLDKQKYETAGYSDAVRAILQSDMWEHNKAEAISVLKRSENFGYYQTVIAIVDSDMWIHDKAKLIKELSES